MREFTHDTIIVPKYGYFYLRQLTRIERGFKELSDELLEKSWKRNPNRISDDEIRLDYDTFSKTPTQMANLLVNAGFSYRDDGVKTTGMYL